MPRTRQFPVIRDSLSDNNYAPTQAHAQNINWIDHHNSGRSIPIARNSCAVKPKPEAPALEAKQKTASDNFRIITEVFLF